MARRSGFWILALMQLAALGAWAQASQQHLLNIFVYNHAGVSSRVLSQAEENATRIFRLSGLHAIWISCSTAGVAGTDCTGLPQPGDVVVQVVHETRKLKDDVFGAAFLGQDGTGQLTDIYFDRVNELHRDWKVSLAHLLAHVMAHEVGHLLLGLNSHSLSGIMRGFWEPEELKAVERGRLLFSSEQSKLMRERLTAISAQRESKNTLQAGIGSSW
ncbi:MAG TPA: hypothetical protein VNX88_03855 [Terriglobales bacterium]|jgi:hypothetical protein|nr:hypothetical protein [Terriglobales bacterium]